jgi:hypothetical protein
MPGVDAGIDVHVAATYPLKWDVLYRDTFFAGPLLSIPAGLGLSFVFNGTAAALTATEDGVWAFTLSVNVPSNLLVGSLTIDGNLIVLPVAGVTAAVVLAATLPLASGNSIAPAWTTFSGPVGAASITPYLQIVRVG